MSNITKNHKVGIFAIFLASAFLMGTISVAGTDSAFANKSEQEIEQENEIDNDAFCVSASTVAPTAACNNIALGLNANLGNIAGGQD